MKLSDMLVSLCKRLRLSKRLHLCKRFHLCKRLRLSKMLSFANGAPLQKIYPLHPGLRAGTTHTVYTFNRTVQSGHPVKSLPSMFYVAWQDYSGIGRPFFIMFPDSPSLIYSMAGGIYLVPGCNNTIHQVCAANLIKENIYLLNISHDVSFLRWEGRVVDIIPSLEDFILKGQWRKLWKFHTFQDRKTTISSSSDRGKKVLSWICR